MLAATTTIQIDTSHSTIKIIFRAFTLKIVLSALLILSIPVVSYSHETDKQSALIIQLNGIALPGTLARSLNQKLLITVPDGKGNKLVVEQTTRAANTRTPIHLHDFSGVTCVIEGEMTLYLEGAQPQRAVAGQCYHMPAGFRMVGFNSGATNAVMHDIFTIPIGSPIWRVVEDGAESYQDQFQKHH